jgi:arsenate reductase (glutaredoxin)
MAAITVYQKKTCGTCKKALQYLDDQGVQYSACDILSTPPTRKILEQHIDEDNVAAFLNSRSAIYREKGMKNNLPDKQTAINLMLEDPNLIKRPLIIKGKNVLFGFKQADVDAAIG